MNQFSQIYILGVRVDILNRNELINFILDSITFRHKVIVSNVNAHAINLAFANNSFRSFINHSDVVFCDGFGVKWAARILDLTAPHRDTPPNWFPEFCRECSAKGHSLFFLGAEPGVAERAADIISRSTGAKIKGMEDGFFDKTKGCLENSEIIRRINDTEPDVLVVGFGMPIQEKWIEENFENISATVFLPVGAMFDYLANVTPRAPHWMTDHGLEWLGRLIIEPRRLWRRYLIGLPVFFWRVLLQRFGLLKLKD